MFKCILTFLMAGFALAACGQATSPPITTPRSYPGPMTETPIPALTSAPVHAPPTWAPSPTPQPTATPQPSATTVLFKPLPTLSQNKPYLMVKQKLVGQKFSIYDANGLGRKIVELPGDGNIQDWPLHRVVSPNGEWMLFYTGPALYFHDKNEMPITLNLLNLRDGSIKKVANVVTDGYLDKLDQVYDDVKNLDLDPGESELDLTYSHMIEAFEWGIYSNDWSPDSRTLAFAAQIDGLSSDVYLYDLETGALRQVEASVQSVSGIEWSPDGKKIVFGNFAPGRVYIGVPYIHVISPGEKVIKNPKTLFVGTQLGDWLSPNVILVAGATHSGSRNLSALNINTGQLITLWADSFIRYAIDQENKIVVVNAADFAQPENLGLHFINFDGRQTKIFKGLYYLTLFFRGGEKHRFLASGISADRIDGSNKTNVSYPMVGTIGLDAKGTPTPLGENFHHEQISISPDHTWLLMHDDEKLYLYDTNDELVKTFPIPGIERIIWRPDSQAIFYSASGKLYYLSILTEELRQVDDSNVEYAVWLP